jgi:Hypoxia induced protein conserved region
MASIWKAAILAALFAVASVLALGLLNMARGGPMNMSQKLMRWRIALQFIAIVIIMTAIYLFSH